MAPGGTNVVLFDPSVVQIGASRLVEIVETTVDYRNVSGGRGKSCRLLTDLLTFVRHNGCLFRVLLCHNLPEPFGTMCSDGKIDQLGALQNAWIHSVDGRWCHIVPVPYED